MCRNSWKGVKGGWGGIISQTRYSKNTHSKLNMLKIPNTFLQEMITAYGDFKVYLGLKCTSLYVTIT